jgi:hypothetical protein
MRIYEMRWVWGMCLCIAHSPLSILTVGTFIVNATLLDTDAALANTRCMRVALLYYQ